MRPISMCILQLPNKVLKSTDPIDRIFYYLNSLQQMLPMHQVSSVQLQRLHYKCFRGRDLFVARGTVCKVEPTPIPILQAHLISVPSLYYTLYARS